MIKYYDVTESALKTKDFEAESIYFCSDTGNIFLDSITDNTRRKMASDVILLANESSLPLAPLPDRLYCVLNTGSLYIYHNSTWNKINREHFIIFNVVASNGTTKVTDSRILSTYTGEFVPDPSVADLASNISVTCSNGFANITLTASYDIPGILVIN